MPDDPFRSDVFRDDVLEIRNRAQQLVQRPVWQDRVDVAWRMMQVARIALRCAARADSRVLPFLEALTDLADSMATERVKTADKRVLHGNEGPTS